jgi:hypothetical protein
MLDKLPQARSARRLPFLPQPHADRPRRSRPTGKIATALSGSGVAHSSGRWP